MCSDSDHPIIPKHAIPVSSEALRLFGYCLMFALVVQAGVLRVPPSQIRHPPNTAHVKKLWPALYLLDLDVELTKDKPTLTGYAHLL